jgi:RecA/RadA recombinase
MKSQRSALIKELLALYIKYGAAEFEATTRTLREGQIEKLIADASDSLSFATKRSGQQLDISVGLLKSQRRKLSKQDSFNELISRLEVSGGARNLALARSLRGLINQGSLSLHSINQVMTTIGVPSNSKPRDRYQAGKQILDYLLELPEDDAIRKAELISQTQDQRGSSLQRWADIIVKREE